MQERDFQSLFTKWIREKGDTYFNRTAAFELKICKENALPWSRVEHHQVQALFDARFNRMYHKISDQSFGIKPFDAFQIAKAEAYLVILFYKPRAKKEMIWIDIAKFASEYAKSTRKSLTEAKAKEISTYIFTL